ncbi:hypothetical protein FA95DRAFT_1563923 [Auriscalpium vulgare]|uniref:Uncharacterized protein n=1 Tax=Auriscalpium vulgare TaxID=40419 RepID=A0ACB8RFY9_9AGAM|nr:hypothetical protein FA95DRAFT_1563923 [Auriscalpium vulgare]
MSSTTRVDASEYPVSSVTVFKSSKAEVVRKFKLSLEQGQNKVEIHRLPGSIDTDSARVTGLGNAQLFDVVCTLDSNAADISPESTAEVVRLLLAKQRRLRKRYDALTAASTTLETYSESLNGEHVSPEQAHDFVSKYLDRSEEIAKAQADLDEEILQLSRTINKLQAEVPVSKGSTNGKVTAVIMTEEQTEIELKLTYIVHNASWAPVYELHATTEDGQHTSTVSLHYRARITQSTGEDWNDVSLTLSTAEMDLTSQTIPELFPTRIRPPVLPVKSPVKHKSMRLSSVSRPPAPSVRYRKMAITEASEVAASEEEEEDWDGAEDDFTPAPFTLPAAAIVKESILSVTYSVDGASSVASDSTAHQVSVAHLTFESVVTYVAVPKAKAVTYLQANVKNTSDYRLLPGPVHVFVDDSFVSQTSIKNDITAGDAFECTLGADPDTRIRYSRTANVTSAPDRPFSEQLSTTTYTSRATIHNRHAFDLPTLIVRDALPVSDDDKRVNVVLRQPEVLIDAKDGEEKEADDTGDNGAEQRYKVRWGTVKEGSGGKKAGLFEWVGTIGAGQELTLEAVWDVKAPASVKWVEY